MVKSRGISLGSKMSEATCDMPPSKEKNKMHYPLLCIDKDLGLHEKDVGKEMTGEIKFKIRSSSKRINSDGKTTHSIDLYVMEINLKPKVSHYAED